LRFTFAGRKKKLEIGSVADPDLALFLHLDARSGSGMEINPHLDPGMNIGIIFLRA
jgi:hypothetical protein